MPKTRSRIRTGTPRKELIGGWCSGKPYDDGVGGDVVQPDRSRLVDEQAQQPVPGGKVTDLRDLVGAHPVVHEGTQPSLRPDVEDTERGVLGVDQGARDRHDPGQHPVQGQVGRHRHHRVQQQSKPGLLVEDALDAAQHLAEQIVELDLAQSARSIDLGPVIAAAVHLASSARLSRDPTN